MKKRLKVISGLAALLFFGIGLGSCATLPKGNISEKPEEICGCYVERDLSGDSIHHITVDKYLAIKEYRAKCDSKVDINKLKIFYDETSDPQKVFVFNTTSCYLK